MSIFPLCISPHFDGQGIFFGFDRFTFHASMVTLVHLRFASFPFAPARRTLTSSKYNSRSISSTSESRYEW
jgi:hypothetical protein